MVVVSVSGRPLPAATFFFSQSVRMDCVYLFGCGECGVSVLHPSAPFSCLFVGAMRCASAHSDLPSLRRNRHQIEDYSLVSFVPLNVLDEDSVELVLAHIDHALQFGEEAEPKDPEEDREPPEPEDE